MITLRLASKFAKSRAFSINNINSNRSTKVFLAPNIKCAQILKFSSAANDGKKESSNLTQVYYGSLTPRMKAVKVFSLTTSLVGIMAQPILLEQGTKIGGTGMAIFLCGFAGFFTFVTPLLLHTITKNYVTEVYYNSLTDEYTAYRINLFLMKKETKFKTTDVKVPDIPGMFTSIIVDKTPLFLDPSQFIDPEHYVRIMGYDKPIDFKIDFKEFENSIKEEKQSEKKNTNKK